MSNKNALAALALAGALVRERPPGGPTSRAKTGEEARVSIPLPRAGTEERQPAQIARRLLVRIAQVMTGGRMKGELR
jgi:hypothetical protein